MREKSSRDKIRSTSEDSNDSVENSENPDELDSVSSNELTRDEVIREEYIYEDINELVESIDLTLVIWLREMYSKYKQPYFTCLDCLELSNYTTKLAEELIINRASDEIKQILIEDHDKNI